MQEECDKAVNRVWVAGLLLTALQELALIEEIIEC